MIGVIFQYLDELIEVRVDGKSIFFRDHPNHPFVPFENLRLNQDGVIKEFPQLKDNENWRKEAIELFRIKLMSMRNEDEIVKYIIEDLSKWGYVPLFKQKAGFRPEKII